MKSGWILHTRSSLPCCRLCSFIAGTKLIRPHVKCVESVAIICSCVSLNTCLIISKRFIFDFQTLVNSSKSQDVWNDNTTLTAQCSYSVLSPQRRCEGSVLVDRCFYPLLCTGTHIAMTIITINSMMCKTTDSMRLMACKT